MRSSLRIIAAFAVAALAFLAPLAPTPAPAQTAVDLSQFLNMWEQTYGPPNLGGIAMKLQGSSANVANASAVATLTPLATRTAFISHFRCSGGGSTAAQMSTITVAGPPTSMIFQMGFVAGVTLVNVPVDYVFDPPVAASAINTAITVTMAAGGAGNTNASCTAEGFQQ